MRKIWLTLAAMALFSFGAVLPALALEGDTTCSSTYHACGYLEYHWQSGKQVTDHSKTYTNDGKSHPIEAKIAWEHHNIFGWATDGVADSGTYTQTTIWSPYGSFNCANGTIYKYYSDHYSSGNHFVRIDGTQWTASGC